MMKARFIHSTLKDVKFIYCDLSRASFRNSILQDVDFTGADLSEVDLSNVEIYNVIFNGAFYNHNTTWSENISLEEMGAIFKKD
ncbi:pentapeptide repeat-containing protein [Paenibacillus xylaniclasticus]